MAKEEKPLEYQHRIRDTKGVAQRLDLDYLKRPAMLAVLRRRLTWALVAAAGLACVPLVLGLGGSRKSLSNGPLSRSHAVFEGRCEVCHSQAFAKVPDLACEKCHDGAAHPAKPFDSAKVNASPPCVQCHIEHRGKTQLAEVSSGNCTSCHRNLTAHASGVTLKGVDISAFRQGGHPEFSTAALQDSRPLRLNHAIHMPSQPRTIRGIKLPMQCVDCHAIDRNSRTGDLVPVTFEQNCRSCHARELEFDVYQVLTPETSRSPHTKDATTIRAYIAAAYRSALEKNPGLATRPLGNDLNAQPNAAAWLEKTTKDSTDFVFERKCVYCHEAEAYAVIRKVAPIARRFPDGSPWLPRAEFAHRSHRAVECDSCHSAARSSTKTADILIPTMKSCLPCHGESAAGLDQCSVCHLYHNRSLEKNLERRPTEQLIGKSKSRGWGLGAGGWGQVLRATPPTHSLPSIQLASHRGAHVPSPQPPAPSPFGHPRFSGAAR